MKKKLLILLILCSIVILNSCSYFPFLKKDKVVITHTDIVKQQFFYCPKPEEPLYEPLNKNKPLCDIINIETLMNNTLKMKHYIDNLKLTIKCYEEQVESSFIKDNKTIKNKNGGK